MKPSKASSIARGGVFSGLCLLMLFLSGLIPYSSYATAALAGMTITVVVIENGSRIALLVYAAVSLLSVFIVPDREASIMFVFFFGYYSIAKIKTEQLSSKLVQYIVKFLIFNVSVILAYLSLIYLLGLEYLVEDLSEFGKYSYLVFLGLGNLAFCLYDLCLSRLTIFYLRVLRPRLGG